MDQADLPKKVRLPMPREMICERCTLPLRTLPHDENVVHRGTHSVLIVSIPFVRCYRHDPGLPREPTV